MEILLNKQNMEPGKLKQLADVLAVAFAQDPIMYSIFINKKEIKKFMSFMMTYFNKYGEIHYTKDLSGVALWLKPGESFISAKNMFSKGLLKDVTRLLFSVSIFSLYRLFSISNFLSKNKPLEAHYYLFAIGSSQKGKGTGKMLMNFALNRFEKEHTYYLENTNVVNNSFYEKFGFSLTKEASFKGRTFFLMSKNAQAHNNSSKRSIAMCYRDSA